MLKKSVRTSKKGNLTKDLNKSIAGIQYNYLNLPSEVKKDNNNNE